MTGSCSAPVVASSPPTQKNGMAHRILADVPEPVTDRMAPGHVDVCRTRVPWVCMTPFGSAVDPEVCTMTARSAGETSCFGRGQNRPAAQEHRRRSVPPCRPAPIRVGGEHDATQVGGRWQGERDCSTGPLSSGSAASKRSATSMSSTRCGATNSPMSASRNTFASSAGAYIVLSGTASAPIRDTASHQTTHSTPLAKNRPTRLPLPTPSPQQPARDVRRPLLGLARRSVGLSG